MEHNTGIHDTFHSSQDGGMATDILEDWRQAAPPDGVSRKREVDSGGAVRSVAFMSGSGMPYPGVGRRVIPRAQDGAKHSKDDREASFNSASDTE